MTLFLALSCLDIAAGGASSVLMVWAKDGTKVAFALAEKPTVTFDAANLLISSGGVSVSYPLENMARFTYGSGEPTDIKGAEADRASFKVNGETLLFPALKANSTVSVYSLNGTLVLKKTTGADGECAIPLSGMASGVYVITVNGLSYKISKR